MAKNISKKASVKDIVQEAIDNNEIEIQEKAEEVTAPIKIKSIPDRNKPVSVMNATSGTTIYKHPITGATHVWNDYGAVDVLDVSTLTTMKSNTPTFLTEPWLIILDDEEVVEYLGLTDVYDNLLMPDEISYFFKLPVAKMEEILERVPRGIKELIATKAMDLVEKDELYDMRIIKLLESTLKIELMEE